MRLLTVPQVERIAFRVAVAAWVVFAIVAWWEITPPLAAGHNAAGAAFVMAGEQMVRWKVFATVFPYTAGKPGFGDYYAHHPWGMTFISAALYKVVGHAWIATRLPAVLFSMFTPPLVYRVARVLWGIVPGAVASVVFVLVPVDLAFSNFWNLEVPTIFFGLVFTLGTVQFWKTWKTRHLLLATFGAFAVTQVDWDGAVLVAGLVLFAFVRAYVLPRRAFGRLNERQHARWFAFVTAAAVGTVLFYIAIFSKYGRMQDLLDGYNGRTTGAEMPLLQVLRGRRLLWLYWMLTPIGLWSAGLGLVVSFGRLLRRDPFSSVLPAWAAAALFEYFVFKQAADTHIFWPHIGGVSIAFGCGTLTWLLLAGRARAIDTALPDRIERTRRVTAAVACFVVLVPLLLMTRVAFPLLWQGRLTAGRFDEGGRSTDSERDKSITATWAAKPLPPDSTLVVHASFGGSYAVTYAADRHVVNQDKLWDPTPKDVTEGAYLLDVRKVGYADLRGIAARYAVTAVGPFWKLDRTKGPGPIRAVRLEDHVPRGWERLALSTDLVRTIRDEEDPWATWEWRTHFGQAAAPPTGEPATFEELRVAHNVAIVENKMERAAALRARLEAMLTSTTHADYLDDVHLLGFLLEDGPPHVMTLLFHVGLAYVTTDVQYLVRSRLTKRPLFWPTVLDYNEKEVATPPPIGPAFWRPRFLYAQRFVLHKRIGTERFYGFFNAASEGATVPVLETGAPHANLVSF